MLKARREQNAMGHTGEAANIPAETERMEKRLARQKAGKGVSLIKRGWILQIPNGKTTVRMQHRLGGDQ